MLAALLILFAAAIPTTLAAETQMVIHGAGVGCGDKGNGSTPTNTISSECRLVLLVDPSSEVKVDHQDKECTNRDLLAWATECPESGASDPRGVGLGSTIDRVHSPECWAKLCSVVPEYLSCFRAIFSGNNTNYHAGAYQLLEDCSLLGYDVIADVGNARVISSAMVLGVPATAIILGAAAVCAFM